MSLSVSIISFNEGENILRTLEALQGLADEIVLVDSFSTDNTVEIAKSMRAKVFQESWKGFIAQKNSALDKCNSDWILALDCDEVITPELAESIRVAMKSNEHDGYALNRRTFYLGKLLKHSWQPDRKLRLVRKRAEARWGGYDPHDVLQLKGRIGNLKGDLIHYSFKDFHDHMQRTIKHSRVAAESYHKKGKKSGMLDLTLKPMWVFMNRLIIRGSILDGIPGVLASFSAAVAVYMKYGFLWEINQKK